MPIKVHKPTTPGRRKSSVNAFRELTKAKPEKKLTKSKKRISGRNNKGRITVRHRGGGAKRRYRLIDFKRQDLEVPAKVKSIEYDPNRSGWIALVAYENLHIYQSKLASLIESFENLLDFMFKAFELILPESVFKNFRFGSSANNILDWEWAKGECFAFKGMTQMGIIDRYRCGVMYRIECWLKALGINYSIDPRIDKCIMHATGTCAGEIRIFTDK